MIDALIVFGCTAAGCVLVVLAACWSARRQADRQVRRDPIPGGRLLPTGEFTGVHAEGTNALEIVRREAARSPRR
jgi:hypothetical protein